MDKLRRGRPAGGRGDARLSLTAFMTLPLAMLAAVLLALPPSRAIGQTRNPSVVPAASTAASQSPRAEPQARPRVCLVLSGGGARGGAHLGVLKVLQELRVPVDCIVGTSAGAIIGAAYASGMPLDVLEATIRPLNTALLFRDVQRDDLPLRRKAEGKYNYIGPEMGLSTGGISLPKGAVSGVALEAVLRQLTARQRNANFDRLPIPFRAVATDLGTAEMVVLDHGSLSAAVRASMALPAIVNPVEINGRLLVDGGVSRNLPVDVARAMGAQTVIAVNIGTPLHERDQIRSLLGVTEQMMRVVMAQNVHESLQDLSPDDVLISPDLGSIGTADFDRLLEAADAGERAARNMAEELRRLRLDEVSYAQWERQRLAPRPERAQVSSVTITGTQVVNPEAVRAMLRLRPGQSFDASQLDADLRRLYATGDFESLSYTLADQADGSQTVAVQATEKSWGPSYLRVGLNLSSDFSGNAYFNLLLAHRHAWLNTLGAEWRNELQTGRTDRLGTEWFQPLDVERNMFISAQVETRREPFDIFSSGQRVARYRRDETTARLQPGLALGHAAELRAGLLRGRVQLNKDTSADLDDLQLPSVDTGGLELQLRTDTLDSLSFPHHGMALDLRYFESLPAYGADLRYDKLDLAWRGATTLDDHIVRAAYYSSRASGDRALPEHELAQLGGFLRMSGYQTGELLGTRAQMGRLVYAYRLTGPGLLQGMELGLSYEVGQIREVVEESRHQGTLRSNALFLAVDTPVGPLYFGVGHAASGSNAVYLFLGQP
ncbi:NTE family protein [Hylemonella gracilis str. Niagara R]|uniref:NTE family protein n=2 Tax=Hylemonella gracilis TaxID=80880 RepID=A0A016XCE3_9BURK|nr:NTE family protein [Hylemonella gracilis str. Niagara R]